MRITKAIVVKRFTEFLKIAKANSYIRKPYSNAIYRTWRYISAVEKERKFKDD